VQLREFTANDWQWVREWYQDAALDRELGPMGHDWLDYVLSRHDGVQLVAEDRDSPVALIGCAWAPTEIEAHVITDIAVAPQARGLGFGKMALELALSWPGHPPSKAWKAYVRLQNTPAILLFTKGGWEIRSNSEGMREFEKRI
jgi:ribosomal protein S18 acetylase RimI-like enzyme